MSDTKLAGQGNENLEGKLANVISFQITYGKSSIPPFPRGLFISNTFEGRLKETGSLLEMRVGGGLI